MHDLPQRTYEEPGVLRRVSSGLQNADEIIGEMTGVAPRYDRQTFTVPSSHLLQRHEIVVVGSGLAGLVAAVSAAELGQKVVVLEISQEVGGLTRLSSGLINAVDPDRQGRLEIADSFEHHIRQTLQKGGYRGQPELVRVLCSRAPLALGWLQDQGCEFSPHIFQAGGSLFPRGHLPQTGRGRAYIETLVDRALQLGVRFCLQHEVIDFYPIGQRPRFELRVFDHNRGKQLLVRCSRLILACGGFSSDTKLLHALDPRLNGSHVVSTLPAKAHVLRTAMRLGYRTSGLAFVQKEVTLPNGDSLPPILRNANGYIAVNTQGKRFMREDLIADIWIEEFLNRANGYGALIANGKDQRMGVYWSITSNIRSLAEDLGLSERQLRDTLRTYNGYVDQKRDLDFNKSPHTLSSRIEGPEYFGAQIQIRVMTTLGGIRIDEEAQVLDRTGKPVTGLFAAGDVTGGIHGKRALMGNLLASALVFGHIAGQAAARL